MTRKASDKVNMSGTFQIQKGMMRVCYALAPCVLASVYLFGWRALAILVVTLGAGIFTEGLFTRRAGKPITSAVFVTCLILALSLPPTIPLWMCVVGAAVAVGLGKMAFGGFGRNVFNPAMAGRCFLYVTFPIQMTNRWAQPMTDGAAGFAAWTVPADAISGATPLGTLREGTAFPAGELFLGTAPGSLGETSALLILLGGAYLLATKVAPWRIALSCAAGGVAVSAAAVLLGGTPIPGPLTTLLSGSFLFGTMFVATEPISGAKTKEGQFVYGFLIGSVTVLLRGFSNFPEGIMFTVLMMNAAVPLLDRGVNALRKAFQARAREATS
jgi:Na+-transporting NADH:ubiquinone oxidoreductase subunit B